MLIREDDDRIVEEYLLLTPNRLLDAVVESSPLDDRYELNTLGRECEYDEYPLLYKFDLLVYVPLDGGSNDFLAVVTG